MSKPRVGFFLGEATGIGPELAAKALSRKDVADLADFVVIGDERILKWGEDIAGVSIPPYEKIQDPDDLDSVKANIVFLDLKNLDWQSLNLKSGELSAESGKITGQTLSVALDLAIKKKIDAVAYGPLNKNAFHRGGFDYRDEIHMFASLLQWGGAFCEINMMDGLWFTRVSSHIPLREVSAHISKESVLKTIRLTHDCLEKAGMSRPHIAVTALNPHAGDSGLFGDEEISSILPAIEAAREEGINATGPYPADTVFIKVRERLCDALVSMYHDQGQIGIKILGFEQSVTVSGGLPVILATPAHGTAFDIAGQGVAHPGATVEAIKIACRMAGA